MDKAAMESEASAFTGDGRVPAARASTARSSSPCWSSSCSWSRSSRRCRAGSIGRAWRSASPCCRSLLGMFGHGIPILGAAARRQRAADLRRRGDGRRWPRAAAPPRRGRDRHRRRGLSPRGGGPASAARAPPARTVPWPPWSCSGCRAGCGASSLLPSQLLRDGHGLCRHRRRAACPVGRPWRGCPAWRTAAASPRSPSDDRARGRLGHVGRPQGAVRGSPPARRSTATPSTAPPPARPSLAASEARRGEAGQREGAGGVMLHWHGVEVPERRGRHRGRDPGRGARRAAASSTGSGPDPRGHVLVPLPPGLPRAGRTRAVRGAGRRPARRRPGVTTSSRSSTSTTAAAP